MINPLKAGITFGALLGGYHLCWSLLVALGGRSLSLILYSKCTLLSRFL